MIEAQGLTKYYGPHMAIQDVTFAVPQGSITGFLGVNGAGKTTTMRILTGFLYPSAGTATVAGHDILENPLAARRSTGYMPENPPLYNEMTVVGFLRFIAGLRGIPRRQIPDRVDTVIEQCGLREVASRIVGRLSKGYRQRLGLAQALVHDPPVLILDEPTVGLDPQQVVEIRNLIRNLRGQHTILFSSHILYEVTQLCDRVIVIHEGRIVAQGSLEELQTGLMAEQRLRVRFRTDAEELPIRLQELPGVREVRSIDGYRQFLIRMEPEEETLTEVIRWLANQPWGLLEARQETLTLEDIFIQLTTGRTDIMSRTPTETVEKVS